MMNTNWSKLNSKQLGQFGEYFAKMMFTSYGWYVYASEVDDHGIDFVAEAPNRKDLYKVQVKAITDGKTLNINKKKIDISNHWLLCHLRFRDGEMPAVYVWKTSEWNNPKYSSILGQNNYEKEGKKSEPEWNVKFSKDKSELCEELSSDAFFEGYGKN